MIVPTGVQCATNVLSLKVHLNFFLEFTLVRNHTRAQHVRSRALTESTLCGIL
jgi:hypothetical protein